MFDAESVGAGGSLDSPGEFTGIETVVTRG
jgi:hypothetical protein